MAFYTICGKPDCPRTAHASYVAQYLSDHLPNFKYRKIIKSKDDWPDYVAELNRKNKWFMVDSPIIWKEISSWGGKSYLLGDIGDFWEYCYCYYGMESCIPKADLEWLARDNLAHFEKERQENSKEHRKYNMVMSILTTLNNLDFVAKLIDDCLQIKQFIKDDGVLIKIHIENTDKNTKEVEDIRDYFNSLGICGNHEVVEIAFTEEEAIIKCDLLIFDEDFSQSSIEEHQEWIMRCTTRIATMADTINSSAKRQLRVIFCNEGPMCLMASCLVEYGTVLIPSNIVCLSAHKGLPVVNIISQKTGEPISKISAPPVWGFIGINEYVDETQIIFKASVLKPYKRALQAPNESTLPLGTSIPELRLMSYLVPNQHKNIEKRVSERAKNIELALQRKSFRPKQRALRSLLDLWYAEKPSDHIISLGVCSNGIHDIPPGIVFSQPCIQDSKRKWRPFANCLFLNQTDQNLKKLVEEAMDELGNIGFSINECYCHTDSETILS